MYLLVRSGCIKKFTNKKIVKRLVFELSKKYPKYEKLVPLLPKCVIQNDQYKKGFKMSGGVPNYKVFQKIFIVVRSCH